MQAGFHCRSKITLLLISNENEDNLFINDAKPKKSMFSGPFKDNLDRDIDMIQEYDLNHLYLWQIE